MDNETKVNSGPLSGEDPSHEANGYVLGKEMTNKNWLFSCTFGK